MIESCEECVPCRRMKYWLRGDSTRREHARDRFALQTSFRVFLRTFNRPLQQTNSGSTAGVQLPSYSSGSYLGQAFSTLTITLLSQNVISTLHDMLIMIHSSWVFVGSILTELSGSAAELRTD